MTTVTATAVLAKAEPPRVRLATSLPGHAPWPRVLTAASYQAHPALPDPAQPAEAPTRQVPPSPSIGVNVAVTRHTLSVLVENKPGVLARVSSLFSRRGFNIHSLAVGPTENPEVSRMTIVVAVEGLPLEQVTKQLNKLINVLKIVELSPTQAVQRELMLVKLKVDDLEHVDQLVQLFGDLFQR